MRNINNLNANIYDTTDIINTTVALMQEAYPDLKKGKSIDDMLQISQTNNLKSCINEFEKIKFYLDINSSTIPGVADKVIEHNYITCYARDSDMNEHIPVLRYYASLSENIVEIGTRGGISSCGLLAGRPNSFVTIDIDKHCLVHSLYPGLLALISNINFAFVLGDSLSSDIINLTKNISPDLLFIDGLHTYRQLKQELVEYNTFVKKFIIMHDTETFGTVGQDKKKPGLKLALEEFLYENKGWTKCFETAKCNGLVVLCKKEMSDDPLSFFTENQ